jgi:DNA-binding transcriptional regulator GbsR (MarR family)
MTFDHIEQAETMRSLRLRVQELEEALEEATGINQVYYEMQHNMIMNLVSDPEILDLIERMQSTPGLSPLDLGIG